MDSKKKDCWFAAIAFISVFYFFAVWGILGINFLYSPTPPDGLNSIGDYLAGAFSPLAFFWLAYGYWMQNKELKLNRQSLEKQIEEFEKSVKTQREIFEFNKSSENNKQKREAFLTEARLVLSKLFHSDILDHSREMHDLEPEFSQTNITFENKGEVLYDLKFSLKIRLHGSETIDKIEKTLTKFAINESIDLIFQANITFLPEELSIHYKTKLGEEKTKKLKAEFIRDQYNQATYEGTQYGHEISERFALAEVYENTSD